MNSRARVDHAGVDHDALLRRLQRHDLRGHGGGSFPTATKIISAGPDRPRLIINVCDGEPLVGKDGLLLQHSPGLVADGAALVARLVRSREVVLAAHQGSSTLAALERLVATEPALHRARVLAVPARYVSSEASALASLAAGGDARPVHHPEPLTHGGPGRGRVPVLVLNAETVARVAALCLDPDVGNTTRLVTLAGDVHHPTTVEAPLTATVGELLGWAGGALGRPRAVLVGGYGGSWLGWSEIAGQTLPRLGRTLGAGLLMVQGEACPLPVVSAILDRLAAESAGQCGPCMFGLPSIAADWRELDHPATGVEAEQRLRRRLPVVSGRGACHHPDGAVGMAATALETFAGHLAGHRRGHCLHPDADAPRTLETVR